MASEQSYPNHYLDSTYGIKRPLPKESLLQYGKAIIMIVAADGQISEQEMRALMALAKAIDAPDDVRQKWREFDWKTGRLEDCIPGLSADPENPGEITLAFLYEAIRISKADGDYNEKERGAVAQAARALGIPSSSVSALENLVEMEDRLRSLRIALLYPTGLSRFHSAKDTRPSLR